MDIIFVLTIISIIVGIIAGIVQVAQYIQDRKEKKTSSPPKATYQNQFSEAIKRQIIQLLKRVKGILFRHQNTHPKNLKKIEKELRMNKYHWITAGFTIPKENFNFTVVYFENQLEVLRNLQFRIKFLTKLLNSKKVSPSHPTFLDKAYEMIEEIDSRTRQINDVLKHEIDHPLSIAAQKASQNFSLNSNLFQKTLIANSMPSTLDAIGMSEQNRELALQLRSLEISRRELQKYLKKIYNFADSIVFME